MHRHRQAFSRKWVGVVVAEQHRRGCPRCVEFGSAESVSRSFRSSVKAASVSAVTGNGSEAMTAQQHSVSPRFGVSGEGFGWTRRIFGRSSYPPHKSHNTRRCFSTTNGSPTTTKKHTEPESIQDDPLPNEENQHSHLLTRATARQLKGDVPEAIALTKEALSVMKTSLSPSKDPAAEHMNEEMADTLLFLGKLYNLEGSMELAESSFAKALSLYQEFLEQQQQQEQLNADGTIASSLSRKALTARSHLASAQGRLPGKTDEASANFRAALDGFSSTVGWEDGMTNHTAYEYAQFCKRNGNAAQALDILTNMKKNLSEVFGANDSRVWQLNSELANLTRLGQTNDGRAASSSEASIAPSDKPTEAPSTSSEDPHADAMALLEEALDKLPPNSPEAIRILMQLEDWKEQHERQQQLQEQNGKMGGFGNQSSVHPGGVVVTHTKGKNRRRR